jgi:POT family proton-dependent oligopeptide transporter
MTAAATAAQAPAGKDILGHPRGLWYLSFCEAFERFSYYGMLALLVLYLTQYLLLPGHVEHVVGFTQFKAGLEAFYGFFDWLFGSIGHLFGGPAPSGRVTEFPTPVAVAAAITGLYSSGVYITPIIGGFLADRVLGRTLTVTIGCVLMVAGHFLMAFDASFVAAILCLFVGVGCFKGNIASQVGELYAKNDLRRADGFQLFFLGIQIAVIAAPIVTGGLGAMSWHYGFGAAGVGMAIALVVYLSGRKYLPPDHRKVAAAAKAQGKPADKLTRRDWAAMALLVVMLPVLAASALGNQEIFNAYLLWGDAHYNLTVPVLPTWIPWADAISGRTMPTAWLVSLDAIVSTVTLIGVVAFWRWYSTRRREPDEIIKIAIGSMIAALGPLVLAWAAANEVATGQKASLLVGLGFHIFNDIGFAMVFPVGLALYSRAAPKSVVGLFIGVYYLHLAICNLATGKIAGLIETMSGAAFWTMHAAIVGGAGVVMLALAMLFHKLLAPTEPDPIEPAVEAVATPSRA